MQPQPSTHSKNLFLAKLSKSEFEKLKPLLIAVELEIGDVVYKTNETTREVYFPETCAISIVTVLENGSTAETGVIGCEGVADVINVLSDNVSPREATVQLPGKGLKMDADFFKTEFKRGGELYKLSLAFMFAFINQISQNSACNLFHNIERRLARWILMIHDCADGDELRLTQEFIAEMLGVHRPSVSNAAKKIQDKNLISYKRGRITVLDREGLEKKACECYKVIKTSYENYCGIK